VVFEITYYLTFDIYYFLMQFKTNIVERVHEAPLRKPGHPPMLRRKHRVYNTVQNNQDVAEFMDVLLAKYVDGTEYNTELKD